MPCFRPAHTTIRWRAITTATPSLPYFSSRTEKQDYIVKPQTYEDIVRNDVLPERAEIRISAGTKSDSLPLKSPHPERHAEFIDRHSHTDRKFPCGRIVLTLHEFSHAFVAYKCGDPTPKFAGRLTLNPLAHFDILGLVMFTLAGFGWAKPVPINAYNLPALPPRARIDRPGRRCHQLYLGPVLLSAQLYSRTHALVGAGLFIRLLFPVFIFFSLAFCVFNLIPLPPLDAGRS